MSRAASWLPGLLLLLLATPPASTPPRDRTAAPVAVPAVAMNHVTTSAAHVIDAPMPSREDQWVLALSRALVALDSRERDTAFAQVLPELLASDPDAVTALIARHEPGDARDALRDEVAWQWPRLDRAAATQWLRSLDGEDFRISSGIALRALAAGSTEQALALADELRIGRDDGTYSRLLSQQNLTN